MNIDTQSLTELKALAYDTISQIQLQQQNLQLINQQIKLKYEAEKKESEIKEKK